VQAGVDGVQHPGQTGRLGVLQNTFNFFGVSGKSDRDKRWLNLTSIP